MSDKTTVSLTESTRAYLERRGADNALKRFNAWVAETDRQLSALAKKWELTHELVAARVIHGHCPTDGPEN